MRNLLVYSDSADIGGHEIQFLNALPEIMNEFNVTIIVSEKNNRFIERITKFSVCCLTTNYVSTTLQFVKSYISFNQISYIQGVIKRVNPEKVLILQGNIEIGSVAVLAASKSHVPFVSYIPVTHFLSDVSQNKYLGRIKDIINKVMFRKVKHFITINEFSSSLIRDRNPFCVIDVVNNGIDFEHLECSALEQDSFNVRQAVSSVLLIGRVLFQHKGHDLLFRMIKKYRHELKGVKFLICGEGDDLIKLKKMISSENLHGYFEFLGFLDKPASVYSGADVVIIPSRFEAGEGTPMVLLEALYLGKKVIMSNLPGSSTYLSDKCLFEVGDIDQMYKVLVDENTSNILSRNSLKEMHSVDAMAKKFVLALR